jgi:hypothetical protein
MPDALKLTPSLRDMLERIAARSGSLLMLAVTASGGREGSKLNKLRRAGYVIKCDHPTVKDGDWPAEALAITDAGEQALKAARPTVGVGRGHTRSRPPSL